MPGRANGSHVNFRTSIVLKQRKKRREGPKQRRGGSGSITLEEKKNPTSDAWILKKSGWEEKKQSLETGIKKGGRSKVVLSTICGLANPKETKSLKPQPITGEEAI